MNLPGPFSFTKRLAAVGLVLFTVAFGGSKAIGYVLTGTSWPNGTVTFQLALGNAGRTLLDGNTSWDAAAAPAGTLWNQNMARTQVITVVNPSASISQGDRVNTIAFANSFFGSSFGSNTLAITGWSTSSGRTVEADILFNNAVTWDSYRGNSRFGSGGKYIGEIRRVLLHEMGHAIGLKHPDQAGQNVAAVMNSVASNTELPTADDRAGANAIYGAPSSSPTPTPTPTATPTPTPTPTPSPTATPTPTPSPSATPTPTPTATPALLPTVGISAAPTRVRTGQTSTFTITRSGADTSAALTVNYAMSGSAVSGRQYRLSSTTGTLTIPAGASSGGVTLTVLSGGSRSKTATMTLTVGSGYKLPISKSATVTITK